MWRQRKLRQICGENRIHVSAYSPLGAPGSFWGSTDVVNNPIIRSIALKHRATPAQVRSRAIKSSIYEYDIFQMSFAKFFCFFFHVPGCSEMGFVQGN